VISTIRVDGTRQRWWHVVRLTVLLVACQTASPPPPRTAAPAPAPAPPLLDGPLAAHLPAAGLRWLVIARPRELLARQAVADAVRLLVPDARWRAHAKVTGLDLRHAETALAAGFDLGTVYMVTTKDENERVEQVFGARLHHDPIVAHPHPRVVRMVGVMDDVPEALVSVRGAFVAFAVGDTTLARIVEAFARRKLHRSPSAMDGAALSSLPAHLDRAPVRFYMPGPFEDEWANAARGLFAACTALAVTATPTANGTLVVTVILAGDFDPGDTEAAERLNGGFGDLAASSTGRLFGLNQPVTPPRAQARDGRLELHVELDLQQTARGLRDAVSGEVWQILDLAPPKHTPKRIGGESATPE